MDKEKILYEYAGDILNSQSFNSEKNYKHHKFSTTYQHSVHVAKIALELVEKFHIKNINISDLVRASLLHDYYLYNWHNKNEKWYKPHAYKHPKIAAMNAERDFGIDKIQYDAITKHMWPLTIGIPKYKESWIITISDKIATFRERFKGELS